MWDVANTEEAGDLGMKEISNEEILGALSDRFLEIYPFK